MRIRCTHNGQTVNGNICEAFDKTSWSCLADEGMCQFQEVDLTDDELNDLEYVVTSDRVNRLQEQIKKSPNVLDMLNDDLYQPVKIAMSIMDKMSPINKNTSGKSDDGIVRSFDDMSRYWESQGDMDYDMGMLASLNAHVAALAAKLVANKIRISEELKALKAKKFVQIKKSFMEGRRAGGKPTNEEIKNLVMVDKQVEQMTDAFLDIQESSELVFVFSTAIDNYINVMKKRLDSLKTERFNTKR